VMELLECDAFDEVEMVIVQPRAGHADGAVRRWTAPKEWLRKFHAEAKAKVEEGRKANARLVKGDHCKWCPAKAARMPDGSVFVCPEWEKAGLDEAQADFPAVTETPMTVTTELPNVRAMPVEKLALAYSWREAIESWFSAVADVIQEKLSAGEEVPGYKLVDGRSNRKWVDEKETVAALGDVLAEDAMYEHKLLSPAKMEKAIGGKRGKELVAELTFKPEAKKAIARDTDPRPRAASKAQDDFAISAPVKQESGKTEYDVLGL